jgi:hypothetical protein
MQFSDICISFLIWYLYDFTAVRDPKLFPILQILLYSLDL